MLHRWEGTVTIRKLRTKVQENIICLSAKPYTGQTGDFKR